MASRTKRTAVSALTLAAALAGSAIFAQSLASAAACREDTYLSFFDQATERCGRVAGTNSRWSALPGGWDNRADSFANDGLTHNACVYQSTNYGGAKRRILRGATLSWSNIVSSNNWTTGSCR